MAGEILDFELPRHFNITILGTKIAGKHQWKFFMRLADLQEPHSWNSFISNEKQIILWGWVTIEFILYIFFYWMRMGDAAQAGNML